MITKELQRAVFKELLELIRKKGADNKMVPASAISRVLTEKGVERPHTVVRITLNNLIKCKYVRYYCTQGFYYYGVTKLGLEKWNIYQTQGEQLTLV